jgi:hypothetical protein
MSRTLPIKVATPTASLVFWNRLADGEAVASSCASASCYRGTKDISVIAIVVLELALCNVERQIFLTDLVVRADNRPLEDRPEALNRLCVDCTDNVLLRSVHDGLMRIFTERRITSMLIGSEQANLRRDGFPSVGHPRCARPSRLPFILAIAATHP